MDHRIINIANELKTSYLDAFLTTDEISIFLCGGSSPEQAAFRHDLGAAIAGTKSKYRYSVHYPEDMFVELILGHQKHDLLTLENLLAKSVSAVVIIVQSPGTFAELGAFSNHDLLKHKLIVVLDPRYQNRQSFINTGPVRHLQRETTSCVVYKKIEQGNLENLARTVALRSREIGISKPPTVDLTNPIACYEFYLALIFTLDPVPRSAILHLSTVLQPDAKTSVLTASETCINALVNQRDVILISGTLGVSRKGIETLFVGLRTDKRRTALRAMLSKVRIEALNVILRKKHRRIWGEVALT